MKKKKGSSILYNVLMVILAGVFLFSAWNLYSELKSYREDQQAYDELEQFVEVPEIETEDETDQMASKDRIPTIDFESLLEINSDCIGWIYIPDTKVSYPVVQGSDNDYYLKHLFNKKYGISGTVFMDVHNSSDMTNRHTILYGHHMKNGTMFGAVEKYEDQNYANEHPKGLYITPDTVYEIEFFAGYQTDAYDSSWIMDFTDAEFEKWILSTKEKSDFESDIIPTVTDQIMTLSTCSYDQADGRFVLVGVIKEKTIE